MNQISQTVKLCLILGMMLTGSTETILSNLQNSQYFYEASYYKSFYHPYCQTTMMFIAMFLSLPFHYLLRRINPTDYKQRELQAVKKGLQPKINPFYLAIPAFFDGCSSTFLYIALNFIPPSVHQMIRGGSIIMTLILSILLLKITIKRFQVIGASMAFIGILIVGASNIIFLSNSQDEEQPQDLFQQLFGYLLIFFSMLFQGFLLVFEQRLFQKFHLQTLYMVGTEGMFGVLIYIIMLPILSFTYCPFSQGACVFSRGGQPYFQRPQQWINQILSNGFLFGCVMGSFMMVFFYNIAGNSITKYINAVSRAIVNISGTVVVWVFGIVLTLITKTPNYQWEQVSVNVIGMQFIGFLILIFGNLIYNEILKIPFLLQKNQQQSKALYAKIQETRQKSSDFNK